ncbi:MAG: hypothetical protein LBF65_00240 [Holosporales bacterium]|jgi:hypothetical protein|nr:hypothetical protein [Holosporales bacterium]
MKKRSALLGIALVAGVIFGIYKWGVFQKQPSPELGDVSESEEHGHIAKMEELHADILRAIVEAGQNVSGVDPQDAQAELDRREEQQSDEAKVIVDISALPNGILVLIAESPASIAGIQPKTAYFELVKRVTGLTHEDIDDQDTRKVLEALQKKKEQKAIDKWAANEDAEAVARFMKKEADKDSSSIANAAYGYMRRGEDEDTYVTYTERYANHPHANPLNNKREEEHFDKVIQESKKLDEKFKEPAK